MNHLVTVSQTLWKDPYFYWFGDIGEIKKPVETGALRVYGYFPDSGDEFVFLEGKIKKKTKDSEGVELARKRLKRLQGGLGSKREFNFEKKPAGTDSEGESE